MTSGQYEPFDKSTMGTAITFLLIGLGAGALIGLLLAPKSGKEMRRDLRRKYHDARDAVEEFKDEAKERVEDAIDRGTEWAEGVKDTVKQKVEPLNRAIRRT